MLGDQLDTLNDKLPADGERLSERDVFPLEKRSSQQRHLENLAITLRPSSSSQRQTESVSALCRDVSRNGCGIVAKQAPRVGDFYRIESPNDPSHLLHGVNARCVRCMLIDEEVFQCGFSFLAPVDLDRQRRFEDTYSDTLI